MPEGCSFSWWLVWFKVQVARFVSKLSKQVVQVHDYFRIRHSLSQVGAAGSRSNGDLEKEICMFQSMGCVISRQKKKVSKLIKFLYVIKQAPKQGHEKIDQVLIKHGY